MDAHLKVFNELKAEGEALTLSLREPWEIAADEIMRYSELLEAQVISQETFEEAIAKTSEEYQKRLDALKEKTKDFDRVTEDLGQSFADAFGDAVEGGEKLSDVLKGLAADLFAIASEQLLSQNRLGDLFGGSGTGTDEGAGGIFSNIFGSLFGGSRDTGGPVSAGMAYMIGKGPYQELFVPETAGNVVPAAGGAGGQVSIGAINLNGIGDRVDTASASQFATMVGGEIRRQLRRNT